MDLAYLIDLELIKQTKYRYMRGVDTQDVEVIRSAFAEDATASYSGGKYVLSGRDAIMKFIGAAIDKTSGTSHIAVHPEIVFDGPDQASGIWRLEDTVNFTRANPNLGHLDIRGGEELQGAGYYYDRYVKVKGQWLISHTGYERLYERVAKLLDGNVTKPPEENMQLLVKKALGDAATPPAINN